MRKQIKDTPNLLKFIKSVFIFMGILNLFQVFVWLMKSGERYSQEYFLGSLFSNWLPGFVIIAFCIGWLISWKSQERIEVVKSKREFLIIALIWVAPLLIAGFCSVIVWNSFMLKDMVLVCLIGYLSGFFIRLSFLGMATAQNFQVVFWQT